MTPPPRSADRGSCAITIDFAVDAEAIVIAVQLDRELAAHVFADAEMRDVRPSELVANALTEHYARLALHG